MKAFMDITGPLGGRLYLLDDEGRLRRTASFALDAEMNFTLEEPLPEGLEGSCVSVPVDWLDFRMVEMDIQDAAAAREILPFELDGLLVGEPSSYVIEAIVPGAAGGTAEGASGKVLAVYMERKRLASLLEGLERAGLDPRCVTSLGLSSLRERLAGGDVAGLSEPEAELEEPARVELARAELRGALINMRRGEFSFRGDVRKGLKSMAFTVSLFVALMLVLSVVFSIRAVSNGRSADALETKVLAIYEGIFPGQKPKSARGLTYKVRASLKDLRARTESARSVETLDTLLALQGALPEGVRLLEITLDRSAALLKGEGPDLDTIERARSAMEGFMSEVKITETGKAVSGQTGFTITARTSGKVEEGR